MRLFNKEESGATQDSQSGRFQKRFRKTGSEAQETAEVEAQEPGETADAFHPYFDEPPQWGKVVLDFTSCDGSGNPVTAEGLSLRKVLEQFNDDVRGIVSASRWKRSATYGMEGVGKTTALKALCYNKEMKQAYHDGIRYLELGKDTDDKKVIKQVPRCVLEFGRRKQAKELEK